MGSGIIRSTLLAFIFSIVACIPTPNHNPKDTADCGTACAHFQEMKCKEGDDLPTNPDNPQPKTCKQFCEDTQNSGHALKPSCIITTKTCEEARTRCQ